MKKKVFRERNAAIEIPLRNKGEITEVEEFVKQEPIEDSSVYFKEEIVKPKRRGRPRKDGSVK